MNQKINVFDYIKLKIFVKQQQNLIYKIYRWLIDWEKLSATSKMDKR